MNAQVNKLGRGRRGKSRYIIMDCNGTEILSDMKSDPSFWCEEWSWLFTVCWWMPPILVQFHFAQGLWENFSNKSHSNNVIMALFYFGVGNLLGNTIKFSKERGKKSTSGVIQMITEEADTYWKTVDKEHLQHLYYLDKFLLVKIWLKTLFIMQFMYSAGKCIS